MLMTFLPAEENHLRNEQIYIDLMAFDNWIFGVEGEEVERLRLNYSNVSFYVNLIKEKNETN